MSANSEIVQQNVNLLQKDMTQIGTIVERIDVSIEKLTEIVTTTTQLLAVQGNRLDMQEKSHEKLQEIVEKHKVEAAAEVGKVYLRMERVEERLQKDMKENSKQIEDDVSDVHKDIIKMFEGLKKDIKEQHDTTNTRISAVEKWMWTIAGVTSAFIVIITLLDNISSIVM